VDFFLPRLFLEDEDLDYGICLALVNLNVRANDYFLGDGSIIPEIRLKKKLNKIWWNGINVISLLKQKQIILWNTLMKQERVTTLPERITMKVQTIQDIGIT
jgi:hypothetical protein